MLHSSLGLFRAYLSRPSLWSVAARVRVPTLVVWGDRDRLVAPRLAARTAAALPAGRLLMLPSCGHTAQLEHPVPVARAVLGLVEGGGRRRMGRCGAGSTLLNCSMMPSVLRRALRRR